MNDCNLPYRIMKKVVQWKEDPYVVAMTSNKRLAIIISDAVHKENPTYKVWIENLDSNGSWTR